MPGIFISYRRDDTGYVARMLAEKLGAEFGAASVFMDIDNIPFGVDFRDHIARAVGRSDVVLALIGDDWLGATKPDGARRLDDPADFVRIEIAHALQQGIPVVPVLAGTARMPRDTDLPPEIAALAFRNAAELRAGRDLTAHVETLIRGLHSFTRPSGNSESRSTGSERRKSPSNSQRGARRPPTAGERPLDLEFEESPPRSRPNLMRKALLLYWPSSIPARIFHVLYYLAFAFAVTVIARVIASPPGVEQINRAGFLVFMFFFLYVPIYLLFWLPAILLNRRR